MPRAYSMARRADLAAATRDRVLQATIDTIADIGPDATTLAAVARRADVAPRTVYYHFATREALFGAAYDYLGSQWLQHEDDWRVAEHDPKRAFGLLIRNSFLEYERNGPLLHILLRLRGVPELDAAVGRVRSRRRAALDEILAIADRDGGLKLPRGEALTLAYGMTSFSTWQTFTEDAGLSYADAFTTISRTLADLIFAGAPVLGGSRWAGS